MVVVDDESSLMTICEMALASERILKSIRRKTEEARELSILKLLKETESGWAA
ncbi:hypothetical protein KSMBR1_1503 [Candidatus Kuenenia stuttgartiensis]|uniref:Uncharacterized protein n=1 Tax=Kuenenia stuttgartiensis TaxID=174633 RepID=A0A2C9CE73_KUEST|nr:hypothetical protein KSMBR1_1503 [Candidatus Kuenenia stuttgartiensis]